MDDTDVKTISTSEEQDELTKPASSIENGEMANVANLADRSPSSRAMLSDGED